MQNSQLIQLFKQLTKPDIRNLRKFLRSPYYNKRTDVIDLFEYIHIQLANKKPILQAPVVYTRLFPHKKYDISALRLVMSYLLKLIQQYLLIDEQQNNNVQNNMHLAKALRKRGLKRQSLKFLDKGFEEVYKLPHRNAAIYQELFLLHFELFQAKSADDPTGTLNRQELSDHLDISYLISKLRQSVLLLSHQAVYQSKFDIEFIDHLIPLLNNHKFLNIPAVAIYYHSYFLMKELDEKMHFETLKELLFKNGHLFPLNEIRDLYLLAINYCIKKMNEGDAKSGEEIFELYQHSLNKKYLLSNNVLSRFTFHNIVLAGMRCKAYDWVDEFIHSYKMNLEQKYRESTFSFSLARLEYHRKNYNKVLTLLQKANYRDVLLNLAAKTVLLKVYYELEETDLLYSHLDAMKNFIRRKSIIGYHKTNYEHIIYFTQKLISINQFDKEEVAKLLRQLKQAEPLTEKTWLIETVNSLNIKS